MFEETDGYLVESKDTKEIFLVVREGAGSAYYPIYPYPRYQIKGKLKPLSMEFKMETWKRR